MAPFKRAATPGGDCYIGQVQLTKGELRLAGQKRRTRS